MIPSALSIIRRLALAALVVNPSYGLVSSCYYCWNEESAPKNCTVKNVTEYPIENCPPWANVACMTTYINDSVMSKGCASIVGHEPITMDCFDRVCYCACRPNCNIERDRSAPIDPGTDFCPKERGPTPAPNVSQQKTGSSFFPISGFVAIPIFYRGYRITGQLSDRN